MKKRKKINAKVKELAKDVEKDIGKYAALEVVKESEGGKLITSALKKDIIAAAEKAASIYKTATHAELIGVVAELAVKMTVFRMISRSSKNKKLALEEFESILEENGDESE